VDQRNPECQVLATFALSFIGPPARDAVPALVQVCASPTVGLRDSAISALGQIHANSTLSVPCLIANLRDVRFSHREWAAEALGKFGPDAKSAIPALLDYCQELKPAAGSRAIALEKALYALQQIDPEHYSTNSTGK
jgi:HEAT repeat protein